MPLIGPLPTVGSRIAGDAHSLALQSSFAAGIANGDFALVDATNLFPIEPFTTSHPPVPYLANPLVAYWRVDFSSLAAFPTYGTDDANLVVVPIWQTLTSKSVLSVSVPRPGTIGSDPDLIDAWNALSANPALAPGRWIQTILTDPKGPASIRTGVIDPNLPSISSKPTIVSGTVSPNGAIALPQGSMYLQDSGINGGFVWVKTSGGSTANGWTAIAVP